MQYPDTGQRAAGAFRQPTGQDDAHTARTLIGWRMGERLADLLWEFPWFRRLLARRLMR